MIEENAEILCHIYESYEQSEKMVIGLDFTFDLAVDVLEIDYFEHGSEGVGGRETPERVGDIS